MAKVTDWHDLWDYTRDNAYLYYEEDDTFNFDAVIRNYEKLSSCAKCSSRRQETMDIKGRDSGYVLAQRIVCKSCGTIIGEIDKRDVLRAKLARGEVLVRDAAAIERDLG